MNRAYTAGWSLKQMRSYLWIIVITVFAWLSPVIAWQDSQVRLSMAEARADNLQYSYDTLGRVIQAVNAATGQAVIYSYDAAGNIASQQTLSISTLAVAGFSPASGSAGTQVTIAGTGFGATASANVVQFNGRAATVISASTTQLVASVPVGATTGPIRVKVGLATALSTSTFRVANTSGPIVTGFSPTVGAAGTAVTISGSNFETVPSNNKVRFNTAPTPVSIASTTSLSAVVPAIAASGKVSVTTPQGIGISAADFIVPPTGYTVSNIASSGRIALDGAPRAINLTTASTISVQLFDGAAGDLLSIGVSSTTLANCTLKVFKPDGTLLISGPITAAGQGLQLPKLTASGTYAIVVDPGTSTGNINLSLLKPIQGVMSVDGAAVNIMTSFGRRVILTFNGAQNSYVTLALSNMTIAAGAMSLIAPDGSIVVSSASTTSGVMMTPQLPIDGVYNILIEPTGAIGGSGTVSLTSSTNPVLIANVDTYTLNLTDQTSAGLDFRAKSGDVFSLGIAISSGNIIGASVSVFNPDGSLRITGTLTSVLAAGSRYGTLIVNTGPVRISGTYRVVVRQSTIAVGALRITLSTPLTGALIANGAPTSIAISRQGQGLQHTFNGTAGQRLSLAVGESGYNIAGAAISVLAPDGEVIATSVMSPAYAAGSYYGTAIVNLGPLPTTGTYTVLVQQTLPATNGSIQAIGTLVLTLSTPLTGELIANGAPTSIAISRQGQGLQHTFNGTAGQRLSLAVGESGYNIAGAAISVLAPDGEVIATSVMSPAYAAGSYYGTAIVNLGPLPTTGTYTVLVQQTLPATNGSIQAIGTLVLTLSTPLTGELIANGAPTSIAISRQGQGLQHTFNGTAGQRLSLAVGESGYNIAGAAISVLAPDGEVIATSVMSPAYAAGSYYGTAIVNLGPLPTTGTYTVLVQQTLPATNGSIQAIGTLALTLTALPTTTSLTSSSNPISPGQTIQFTATVTGVSPTGSVTFKEGAVILGVAAITAGTAAYSTSSLAIGTHQITATYNGDLNNASSISSSLYQVVSAPPVAAASSTVLGVQSGWSTTAPPGIAIRLLATVTTAAPVPTSATVTFRDGSAVLGTANYNSAYSAWLLDVNTIAAPLNVGTHNVTATFNGDVSHASSVSQTLTLTISPPAASTTNLAVQAGWTATAYPGERIRLIATVATAAPVPTSATVTFREGATVLGTASYNSAYSAWLFDVNAATTPLSIGTHVLTASFNGDSSHAVSTSSLLTLTINSPAPSTTSLAVPTGWSSTAVVGMAIRLQASVATAAPVPSGAIVTFKDGSTVLGTASYNATSAAWSLDVNTVGAPLSVGTHSVTATFAGDVSHAASTSVALMLTINSPIATAISLTMVPNTVPSGPNPAIVGGPVRFNAGVTTSSGTLNGTVTFRDGGTVIGSGPVNYSSGYTMYITTLITSSLAVGTHSITAEYSGDTSHATSVSGPITQNITDKTVASIAWRQFFGPPSSVLMGTPFNVQAVITGTVPTGTVTFWDDTTLLATTSVLADGRAVASLSMPIRGSRLITVRYTGDASNTPAQFTASITVN